MFRQYINDYDEQEDDDYNPTKKQQAIYKKEHEKRVRTRFSKSSVNQLWLEVQSEYKKDQQQRQRKIVQAKERNPCEIAKQILNSKQIKPDQKVIFAGKQFILNEQTGQLQQIEKKSLAVRQIKERNQLNQQDAERHEKQIAFKYLNHVLKAIYNRGRKINSIGKSKIDWKGFVKQQGIEDKLSYNRKGGVIQDLKFMKNAVSK